MVARILLPLVKGLVSGMGTFLGPSTLHPKPQTPAVAYKRPEPSLIPAYFDLDLGSVVAGRKAKLQNHSKPYRP